MENQVVDRIIEDAGMFRELEGVNERFNDGSAALRAEITDCRQAAKALNNRARLLDLVADAVIIFNDSEVITFWSEGAERIYGWNKAEALGKTAAELVQPVFPCAPEQIQEELARHGQWHGEVQEVRRDGTRLTLDSRRVGYAEPGLPPMQVVLNRDISERKLLQNQLWQAQKMEAVGRLAGGIAHDFNNLLTIIMGRGELLLSAIRDEKIRADLSLIINTGARAAALTRQLLAFSRKQRMQPRKIDLSGLVSNTEKMLVRLIGEDIKLIVHSVQPAGTIYADPSQIEQVILNLAVNARDAMPQGGKLIIETANVDIDAVHARLHADFHPGPFVMLAVSDTGVGMDARTQAQIFEPFFTTKEPGKGTGLGLSTVYGIVKQSGGFIWMDSQPGHGATFKIYLPRVNGPVEVVTEAATCENANGSETILLVEDEDGVRQVIREILQHKGYTVLEARNGEEALGIWDGHPDPIDMVITDLVMPDMNGEVLIKHLRNRNAHLKVLYMSGYTDPDILSPGKAVLQKPISHCTLELKLRELLDA